MFSYLHIVRLLIVFSFLFISKLSFPQYDEVKFEHITVEDGLPENSITCILQDHLGFLWLGTQNGLVKYDGYTMTVYRSDPDDTSSISGNGIWAMCEDHNGNIWIGAGPLWAVGSGLNRFDRNTETFKRYVHNPADTNSINSNTISIIYEDAAGRLWIGTDKGLNLFNDRNSNFYRYYFQDAAVTKEGKILAIGEDQTTGDILIGSELPGLWKCDVKQSVLTKYILVNNDSLLNTCTILHFQKSKDSLLWMGTNKGFARYDLLGNQLKLYQEIPPSEYIEGLRNDFVIGLKDKRGLIWVGAYGEGLTRFNPETEKFQWFKYDRFNSNSLSGNTIWSMYEDRSGILWVGTHIGGLNKWDRKKWKFKHYSHDPQNPNSLSENQVTSICEDRTGLIWVGTKEGALNLFDQKENRFIHYQHNPNNLYSISSDGIECIAEDPVEPGVLWIGTWEGGLDKFEQEKGIFAHYQHNPADSNSISHNHISTLFIDRQRVLWVGTWGGGLNRYDRRTNKFTRFRYDPKDSTSLSEDLVSVIFEDKAGTLWIGTDGFGINRYNPESENFVSYKSLSNDERPTIITYLYEDESGNFWVGTYKEGIYLFDRDKGISIKNYNENDGLANNLVSAILEDDSGNLWISTSTGLSKFNPQTETFKNYGSSDGLEGIRFYRRSAIKVTSGEMIFGGEHGFNIFYPDNVKDDPFLPQVVITNVSLFNRPGEKIKFEKYVAELDEIKLSYNQNDLRFDYVGLHFSEPKENKYKYILEGFDDDWIDAGNQRNATYTNLDPGEYIFKIIASNRDGIWNEDGASLVIIISPPWWATTWAYIIYALIILSIIYFTWWMQLKRIRIKHDYQMSKFEAEKMHEVDEMKSRFFANISQV